MNKRSQYYVYTMCSIMMLVCLSRNGLGARENNTLIRKRRIVGGFDCNDVQQGYAAVIINATGNPNLDNIGTNVKKKVICGGSYVTSTWVLTAAHCFDDWCPYFGYFVLASVGELVPRKIAKGGATKIAYFVKHPQYSPTVVGDYDICMVRLTGSLTVRNNLNYIRLPTQNELDNQELAAQFKRCVVMGFGLQSKSEDEKWPEIVIDGPEDTWDPNMQCAILYPIPKQECHLEQGGGAAQDYTCTKPNAGLDFCIMDHGGPLICGAQRTQYGVMSYGGCNNGQVSGVHVRTDLYVEFIRNTINEDRLSRSITFSNGNYSSSNQLRNYYEAQIIFVALIFEIEITNKIHF